MIRDIHQPEFARQTYFAYSQMKLNRIDEAREAARDVFETIPHDLDIDAIPDIRKTLIHLIRELMETLEIRWEKA